MKKLLIISGIVIALLLLAGVGFIILFIATAQQRQTAYNEAINYVVDPQEEQQYVSGCVNGLPADERKTLGENGSNQYCGCTYTTAVKTIGRSRFSASLESLQHGTVTPELKKIFTDCSQQAGTV